MEQRHLAGHRPRYENDWNRSAGVITRTGDPRAAFICAARDAAECARIIHSVPIAGVPEELADIGKRLADLLDTLPKAILSRLDPAAPAAELDAAAAQRLSEDLETLRKQLSEQHDLELVPITVINPPGG